MQTDSATPVSEMPPMPSEELAAAGTAFLILYLAILVIFCVGCWKMVAKAGLPGILGLIPIVGGLLYMILVSLGIAERFGRGVGTALGLIFLPFIFVLILGFGDAKWSPPTSTA